MSIKTINRNSQLELENLFETVFTSSVGELEGHLIGKLVSMLASAIDNREIICIGKTEREKLIGSVFFTRLRFKQELQIFMLAPVAVATACQGKGVGRALIEFGLKEMQNRDVSAVVTYGDPAYYSRIGFHSLSEEVIKAPLELSMPEGWLGQSLSGKSIRVIEERPGCAEAFNDPAYW